MRGRQEKESSITAALIKLHSVHTIIQLLTTRNIIMKTWDLKQLSFIDLPNISTFPLVYYYIYSSMYNAVLSH